ncbi:hypothetical protein [Ruegeria sp. SCP11]|uniref:hypothetical protein n=1 Tax=Ruegeria sp. SCP11 TaxID=3141378 RepID=UPI003334F572
MADPMSITNDRIAAFLKGYAELCENHGLIINSSGYPIALSEPWLMRTVEATRNPDDSVTLRYEANVHEYAKRSVINSAAVPCGFINFL